jgi:hypothetical protein
MENNTLREFLSASNLTDRIRSKLLETIKLRNRTEIVLNLFNIDFDYQKEIVLINYYVVDKKFPSVNLTFDQFKELLCSKKMD